MNAVEALSGYDVLALLADDLESVIEAGMQDELALIDALERDGKVGAGVANSLRSKLSAAAGALERGDSTAARNQLNALVNEIEALSRSGRLGAGDATTVKAAIDALLMTLQA